MMFRAISAAALLLATLGSANAAYLTYFGKDLNTSGNPENTPLDATPNSNAAAATFLSKVTNESVENFESAAIPGSTSPRSRVVGPGETFAFADLNGNKTMTASVVGGAPELMHVTPGTTSGFGQYSVPVTTSQFLLVDAAASAPSTFELRFSQAVAAFGFNGIDVGDLGGTLEIQLLDSNGAQVGTRINLNSLGMATGSSANGSVFYMGLIADVDFSGVRFILSGTTSTDTFAFDNFTIAARDQVEPPTTSVPEPMSALLLGIAMLGLATTRRGGKR